MKANQLRIGNLILWDGDEYIVKRSFWDQYKDDESDIEFIPLTEEWFLKFGYKRLKDHLCILGHLVWTFNGMFICDKNGVILKYVHQLQNLYFARTEKELTLK
jgi:hypothetical protein